MSSLFLSGMSTSGRLKWGGADDEIYEKLVCNRSSSLKIIENFS